MEDNKHNDLNEFFKSRLQDSTPADNGWNIPPLSVLDGALDQLPEPPQRNKLLIPFVTIGILAMSLMAITVFNTMKISKLSGEIESLNKSSILNQNSTIGKAGNSSAQLTQQDQNPQAVATESTLEKVQQESSENLTTNSPRLESRQGSAISPPAANPVDQKSRLSESNVKKPLPSLTENTVAINNASNNVQSPRALAPVDKSTNNLVNSQTHNQARNVIGQFPLLHTRVDLESGQAYSPINLTDKLTLASMDTPRETTAKKRASIFITGSHLATDIRMTNIDPNVSALTRYDNSYPGVGLRVGIALPLNNTFSLNTSIGYNNLNNKSQYDAEFIYYENNTIDTGMGNLMHLSSPHVETPMVDFSDEITLRVNDSEISNGEKLDQVTDISDTYQIAQLSTTLSAKVLRYKNLSIHTGVGLSGNFILNLEQGLDTKMKSNSSVMMEETMSINLTQEINRSFLSGSLSLGLQYDFSDSIYLRVNSRYEKGLTSLRVQATNDQPQSYLNSFGTEMTLGYAF